MRGLCYTDIMTTKGAIKLLPLEDKLKMQVLNMYDYMEPDQKLTIEVIVWRYYHYTQQQELEKVVEEQLEAVEEGTAQLGESFGKAIRDKATHNHDKHISEKASEVDLAAARQAMERIMQEIQAAKKTPKQKN